MTPKKPTGSWAKRSALAADSMLDGEPQPETETVPHRRPVGFRGVITSASFKPPAPAPDSEPGVIGSTAEAARSTLTGGSKCYPSIRNPEDPSSLSLGCD